MMSTAQGEQPRGLRLLQIGPIPWFWTLLILLGVVLMVAGGIAGTSTGYFITPAIPPNFSSTCDRILIRNLSTTGSLLGQTGALLLVLGFLGAAALSPNLDRGLRAALIIGGVVILVFPLTFFRFPMSSFYC